MGKFHIPCRLLHPDHRHLQPGVEYTALQRLDVQNVVNLCGIREQEPMNGSCYLLAIDAVGVPGY